MTKISLALVVAAACLFLQPASVDAGCETVGSYNSSTWQSCAGDRYANSGCYGRCGPECSWSFLGNTYTNACKTHDWCVRNGLSQGRSQYSAHANCVSSFGSAARSWFNTNWHSWKGKIRDKWTGFVSNWL